MKEDSDKYESGKKENRIILSKLTFSDVKRKKIAWGITGGGHLLRESVKKIKELLESDYWVEIFFSRAGKEVCKMFGELKKLENMKKQFPNRMDFIFSENQEWSFPVCGKFSLKNYDILIVSPTTANTVAKLSHKIADTLITNIVSQSLKGNIPVIIIPTDYKVGPCTTVTPGNKEIIVELHESDIERTEALKEMRGMFVAEKPSDILLN
ncbi:MAG: flavoprotein [Promethearchaeota archaeon]